MHIYEQPILLHSSAHQPQASSWQHQTVIMQVQDRQLMVHGLRKTGLLRIFVVPLVSHMSCAHLLSIKSHCKTTPEEYSATNPF